MIPEPIWDCVLERASDLYNRQGNLVAGDQRARGEGRCGRVPV